MVKERDFKKEELLEKYIIKILYRWNDKKFGREVILELKIVDFILFSYFLYLDLFAK